MNTVTVRNVEIGAGMPKICVPIVGETREDILAEARAIRELPADLVEWRVDFLNNVSSLSLLTVLTFLSELRNELGDLPLLFTFRTKREGGEKSISPQAYEELYKSILSSGLIDLSRCRWANWGLPAGPPANASGLPSPSARRGRRQRRDSCRPRN